VLKPYRAFAYVVAISYAISDLDSVLSISSSFPLTGIYMQATGSTAGAIGLTAVVFLAYFAALPDTFIASGRTFWALSRDKATPFSKYFAHVSERWDNPVRANLLCACVTTAVGCIYVGNTTAFNAFVGSFVVLGTVSYAIPIIAHMMTRRKSVIFGPFRLGRYGWFINFTSLVYIIVSDVLFCFPFALPVDAANMNYVSVILISFTTFITTWWFWHAAKNYEGPVSLFCAKWKSDRQLTCVQRNIFPRSLKV
jgi:choline transport protein